jgi:hypothetical protein
MIYGSLNAPLKSVGSAGSATRHPSGNSSIGNAAGGIELGGSMTFGEWRENQGQKQRLQQQHVRLDPTGRDAIRSLAEARLKSHPHAFRHGYMEEIESGGGGVRRARAESAGSVLRPPVAGAGAASRGTGGHVRTLSGSMSPSVQPSPSLHHPGQPTSSLASGGGAARDHSGRLQKGMSVKFAVPPSAVDNNGWGGAPAGGNAAKGSGVGTASGLPLARGPQRTPVDPIPEEYPSTIHSKEFGKAGSVTSNASARPGTDALQRKDEADQKSDEGSNAGLPSEFW